MKYKRLLYLISVLGMVLILAPSFISPTKALASSVTIHVQDQYGSDIVGSVVTIDGIRYHNGDSVDIAPGTYSVTVVPGINGEEQTANVSPTQPILYRVDEVAIVASQTLLNLEWKTAAVTLAVRDQSGVDIPESMVALGNSRNGWLADIFGVQPVPLTVDLPINTYPHTMGLWSTQYDGYDFMVVPGLNGEAQNHTIVFPTHPILYRSDGNHNFAESSPVLVDETTTEIDLVAHHKRHPFRQGSVWRGHPRKYGCLRQQCKWEAG